MTPQRMLLVFLILLIPAAIMATPQYRAFPKKMTREACPPGGRQTEMPCYEATRDNYVSEEKLEQFEYFRQRIAKKYQ